MTLEIFFSFKTFASPQMVKLLLHPLRPCRTLSPLAFYASCKQQARLASASFSDIPCQDHGL